MPFEEKAPGGVVQGWCHLTDELLLLAATFPIEPDRDVHAVVSVEGSWRPVRAEITTFETPSANGAAVTERRLVLMHLGELRLATLERFGIRSKTVDLLLEPAGLAPTLTSLEAFIREELLAASTPARAQILEFLLRSTADVDRSPLKLSQTLFLLREALRERVLPSVVDPTEPRAIAIDAIWRLDEQAFYVEGWIRHEGQLERLTAISPEGEQVEIGPTVFRYPRSDVREFYAADGIRGAEKPGFIAYFETLFPSRLSDGWLVQLYEKSGASIEAAAPSTSREPTAARSTILGDLSLEPMQDDNLKVNHILPALNRVQHNLIGSVEIDTVDTFGVAPRSPEVSVVIPLYKRVDFIEHQLAQFVHDPELREADIVYVLDSPEQADYLRDFALQLHRLYRVPFRLVTLTRNGGFSVANNAGASIATGRLLLLLNSDVLPEAPGWLGRMVSFYDATPKIGALSPMLLYEDESLQHAGLYFERQTGSHVWANEHFFKGLHRSLPAANVARAVPAVTGACMLIAASLYAEHGGLRGGYVQGDYEDSDLCLRLAEAGLESWYLPSVALYHLEGQSYPSDERKLASQFNRWLHTYLWNDAMEQTASASGAGANP